MTDTAYTFNRRGGAPVTGEAVELADAWGAAAREETDPTRRAIALAAHAEALRVLRKQRNRT